MIDYFASNYDPCDIIAFERLKFLNFLLIHVKEKIYSDMC